MTKYLKYVLRLALWLLIIGITLELGARTEDYVRYHAPFWGNYDLDTVYQYDSMGKWGRPNASYLKWHMNDLGYRGPALREGTDRIVTFGSSETFGLYETPENEWPRQLEHVLNARTASHRFEVVNVAYPGLSIGTTVERLPLVLATLKPQIAVIYPSYAQYTYRDTPVEWKPEMPHALPPSSSGHHLRIQGKAVAALKQALPVPLMEAMYRFQIWLADRHQRPKDALPEKNVEAFRSDLDLLLTKLQENGVQVVLTTHATRFGPSYSAADPDQYRYMLSWESFYPDFTARGLMDVQTRLGDVVRQEGALHHLPVVDTDRTIPPGPASFYEFVHFNDNGARSLATSVADQILAMPPAVKAQ